MTDVNLCILAEEAKCLSLQGAQTLCCLQHMLSQTGVSRFQNLPGALECTDADSRGPKQLVFKCYQNMACSLLRFCQTENIPRFGAWRVHILDMFHISNTMLLSETQCTNVLNKNQVLCDKLKKWTLWIYLLVTRTSRCMWHLCCDKYVYTSSGIFPSNAPQLSGIKCFISHILGYAPFLRANTKSIHPRDTGMGRT